MCIPTGDIKDKTHSNRSPVNIQYKKPIVGSVHFSEKNEQLKKLDVDERADI